MRFIVLNFVLLFITSIYLGCGPMDMNEKDDDSIEQEMDASVVGSEEKNTDTSTKKKNKNKNNDTDEDDQNDTSTKKKNNRNKDTEDEDDTDTKGKRDDTDDTDDIKGKDDTETDDKVKETTCNKDGEMRCAAAGGVDREVCRDGKWVAAKPCADGMACNMNDTKNPGECISAAELCKGSSGENVCNGPIMYKCGKNGAILGQTECKSERLCQLGSEAGECAICLPGTHICIGAELQECNKKGTEHEPKKTCTTSALCNATAGACTTEACLPDTWDCTSDDMLQKCNEDQTGMEDFEQCRDGMCDVRGKECDICIPGDVKCDGDKVVTCTSDGQDEDRQSCPYSRSHCIGSGTCVECRVDRSDCSSLEVCNPQDNTCVDCLNDDDCPDDKENCEVGRCTSAKTCTTDPAPENTRCKNSGYCTSKGECVKCNSDDHCGGSTRHCDLKDTHTCKACVDDDDCTSSNKKRCDPDTYTCVECYNKNHCVSPEKCEDNKCLECVDDDDCGYNYACQDDKCKEIYRTCLDDNDCDSPYHRCIFSDWFYIGMCVYGCVGSSNCNELGDWNSTCTGAGNEAYCAIECNGTKCPQELYCDTTSYLCWPWNWDDAK